MNILLKKTSIVAFILCIVLSFFSGCKKTSRFDGSNETLNYDSKITIESQGLQRPYKSLKELTNKADTIFIGKVISVEEPQVIDLSVLATESEISSSEVKIPPRYHVQTVSNVEVMEVIKGDLKIGHIVDVKQDGGVCGNIQQIYDDTQYYKVGDEYIFFTYHFIPKTPRQIEVIKRELYVPATSYEGQIKIDNNKFILDNERLVKLFSDKLKKALKINDKLEKDDILNSVKEDLKNNTNNEQVQESQGS